MLNWLALLPYQLSHFSQSVDPIFKILPRWVINLHSFSFEVFGNLITMATSELAPPVPPVGENAPPHGMFKLNVEEMQRKFALTH